MEVQTVPSVVNGANALLGVKASVPVAMAVEADVAGAMRVAANVLKAETVASRAASATLKVVLNARLLRVVVRVVRKASAKSVKTSVRKMPVPKADVVVVNVANVVIAVARRVTPQSRSWHWPTKPRWLRPYAGKSMAWTRVLKNVPHVSLVNRAKVADVNAATAGHEASAAIRPLKVRPAQRLTLRPRALPKPT